MDDTLYFTAHHHEVREMVRDFARDHVAPIAREIDRSCTFPWENIKRMGELGLLGVPWPEELGGKETLLSRRYGDTVLTLYR